MLESITSLWKAEGGPYPWHISLIADILPVTFPIHGERIFLSLLAGFRPSSRSQILVLAA